MSNSHLKLVISFVSISFLSGCATAFTSQMPVSKTTYEKTVLMDDNIYAVGQTRNQHELILIGANKTYHLTQGNRQIAQLMNLDPNSIIVNQDLPIELVVKNQKFSGKLQVHYNVDVPNEKEQSVLNTVGFKKVGIGDAEKKYYASFAIAGTLYARSEQTNEVAITFSRGREVQLVTVDQHSTVDARKALDKAMALPLALTFDIVTAPLQILLLSHSNKR